MEDRPTTPQGSTSPRTDAGPPRARQADARPSGTPASNPSTSSTPTARPAVRRPGADEGLPRLRDSLDLLVALALVLVAAAARLLPEENTMRLLLTLPVLLFVPGYLLIQMFAPAARTRRDRTIQTLIAAGASPAVIGLLALTTAIVPGGFRPTPIVVVVTGACVLFAVVAYMRRWLLPTADAPVDAATA